MVQVASLAGHHRTHADIGCRDMFEVNGASLESPPPAEFCPLKPPPVAKGWEVRMPPAPVSPPMIFAERRPWKPGAEKGAGGSNVTPGFTFNVYYLPRLPMSYRSQWLRPSSVEGSSTPLPKIAYRTCTARLA